MSRKGEDDFYVGYMKTAPEALGSVLRKWIIGLLLLTGIVSAGIILTQQHFTNGIFEFGDVRTYQGLVRLDPVPIAMAMDVLLEKSAIDQPYYLLVNQGKFGAREIFAEHDGEPVEFQATLIHRDGQKMLEVVPGSVKPGEFQLGIPSTEARDLGQHVFNGEIVDSKCYLGVMSPGNLKTHKACAIRCLSGGVPPVLVVRDEQEKALYLILIGPNGEAMNEHVLDKVAAPVEITGTVEEREGFYYLRAAPEAIRRL